MDAIAYHISSIMALMNFFPRQFVVHQIEKQIDQALNIVSSWSGHAAALAQTCKVNVSWEPTKKLLGDVDALFILELWYQPEIDEVDLLTLFQIEKNIVRFQIIMYEPLLM